MAAHWKAQAILLLSWSIVSSVCSKQVGWSISRIKALDRPCLKCACMGTPANEKYRDDVLEIRTHNVYNAIGSKENYYWMHYMLSAQPVTSNKDIDRMCHYSTYHLPSETYMLHGHGINTTATVRFKKLSSVRVYNIQQLHDPMEMSTESSKDYTLMTSPARISVVWVNRKKGYLWTYCNWDGSTGWSYYSVDKVLSPALKQKIMEKVIKLGFNPENVYAPNWKKCSS